MYLPVVFRVVCTIILLSLTACNPRGSKAEPDFDTASLAMAVEKADCVSRDAVTGKIDITATDPYPYVKDSNFTIYKYCMSIYNIVDAGGTPPDPLDTLYFTLRPVSRTILHDTLVTFTDHLGVNKVNCSVAYGSVDIKEQPSYYTGFDGGDLHRRERGIRKFDLTIDGKSITFSLDHILHPLSNQISMYADDRAGKLFIRMSNGDGAGTSFTLLVADANGATGHYDWEYGMDEWYPRNNLDMFQRNANDTCHVYVLGQSVYF